MPVFVTSLCENINTGTYALEKLLCRITKKRDIPRNVPLYTDRSKLILCLIDPYPVNFHSGHTGDWFIETPCKINIHSLLGNI